MNTTSLVAEFILIGWMPFLTIGFSVLSIYHVYDFGFLAIAKDYSTVIIFISTLLIYLLGALINRLAQVLNNYFLRPALNSILHRKGITEKEIEDASYKSALVYQFGSAKLIDRM
jgi:hypothetical protein